MDRRPQGDLGPRRIQDDRVRAAGHARCTGLDVARTARVVVQLPLPRDGDVDCPRHLDQFEEDAYKCTVRVQWDDGAEMPQQWQASESGQELFAPDGVAFVRQLASVNRLRFGFTPFNAQPATVEFAVRGFDQLAGLVASTCGWRLDLR